MGSFSVLMPVTKEWGERGEEGKEKDVKEEEEEGEKKEEEGHTYSTSWC